MSNEKDTIYRQAAIDEIEYELEMINSALDSMTLDFNARERLRQRKGEAIEILNSIQTLPSTQPEPQWIPCSERMPEEHEWLGTKEFGTTISDEVYVTFENEKGERFCKHMTFQNGKLSRYDKAFIEAWYKGSKPIAWMPLPEPYKER